MTDSAVAITQSTSPRRAFLLHLLEVVGLRGQWWSEHIQLLEYPQQPFRQMASTMGRPVVLAIRPGAEFCKQLGVSIEPMIAPADLVSLRASGPPGWFRTLHAGDRYRGHGVNVLVDANNRAAWKIVSIEMGVFILCGTELVEDLIRWRQGDPSATSVRPTEAAWGIPGERPNYLFEVQLEGLGRSEERQADKWSMMTARLLAELSGKPLASMLPDGAPGAIVITGDDDQASLEKYQTQIDVLGPLPVTYFLHPKTRHTRASMRKMFAGRRIELGIHPDALDSPGDYAAILEQQCAWFSQLTGELAKSVRNHGFLNDGYWEHAVHWIRQNIRISSNLPGLDGRPLNGSFLPARLFLGGQLTDHWSVVTAVGDGVRYVDGGRDPEAAARCITECAHEIRSSGIPGVMVLNLHPQNVDDTLAMHAAARAVSNSGFLAWTMQDCLNWFAHGQLPAEIRTSVPIRPARLLHTLDRWMKRWSNKEHG